MATNLSKNTLAKGLRILEVIAEENDCRGVGLSRIVEICKLNRSNVYRYLKTMVDCGWLEYDLETYRYRIGGKPLQVAGSILQRMDLRVIARPYLENLAKETCLAIHLGVMRGPTVIYIDKVESNSPIQMRSRVGMTVPSYSTAMGKALLATLSSDGVMELLDEKMNQRTPNTIISMEDLLADLNRIRERGYSIDQEENELGIGCIGAALYGYDDEVIGAISLSTLIYDLPPEKIARFGQRIMKTAREISRGVGCNRDHWPIETEFTLNWIERKFAAPEKEVNA